MAKKFWGNKKKLFLTIFGIAVLAAGFWLLQAPKAEAFVYTLGCVGSSELECYNDAAGASGYTGCLSSAECCLVCNTYKSTCAITDAGTDHFTDYEFNLGGTGSCSDATVLECQSGNATGACPNTVSHNGKRCTVRKINPADSNEIFYYNSDTFWDGPQKACIACGSWVGPADGLTRNNTEAVRCGDIDGIYLAAGGFFCNGNSLEQFKFKAICGADAACDGKVYTDGGSAPSCTGGTCNLSGACVATGCPDGDFTCQNECTPVNNHQCVGVQLQECITTCDADIFLDWCNAAAETEAGNCNDNYDNDCDGNTDYADTVDCPTVTCTTWFGDPVYKKGQTIDMFYSGVTCGTGTLELTDPPIPVPATSKKISNPPSACSPVTNSGFMTYTVLAADEVGTWTVTLDNTADVLGNACPTRTATTKVVECFNNADCTNPLKPECNASGNCVAAGPPPTPNCASTMCGAANAVPCTCGGTVINGANVWCGFTPSCNPGQGFATQLACQAACLGACTANGGACAANGDCCSNNCTAGLVCAAACTADGGACLVNGDCCSNNCVAGTCLVSTNCNPNAWFFCNPLRGTVDNIVQAGETLLGYILGLIGSIALLVIIISGAIYMTSAGSEEKIATSKRILTGAVIGIIIALLAYSLLQVIISIL